MKTQFYNNLMITALIGCVGIMSSCSKMKFTDVSALKASQTDLSVDIPTDGPVSSPDLEDFPIIDVPPAPPVVVQPQYQKTSGLCASDSSTAVTSCLKCQVPAVSNPEPMLGVKAKRLLDIMTMACQVPNKWDPVGYKAPSREQIIAKISRCTDLAYPDSKVSKSQAETLSELQDPNDNSLRVQLFSKYYISPPDSNNFETHFGFNGQEVRQMYCHNEAVSNNDLHAPQYYQSITTPWDAGVPLVYKNGNVYRNQLKGCMQESVNNPWSPAPVVTKSCKYETMSGPNGVAITAQLEKWLADGHKVGIDIPSQKLCGSVTSAYDHVAASGDVVIGAYICE